MNVFLLLGISFIIFIVFYKKRATVRFIWYLVLYYTEIGQLYVLLACVWMSIKAWFCFISIRTIVAML